MPNNNQFLFSLFVHFRDIYHPDSFKPTIMAEAPEDLRRELKMVSTALWNLNLEFKLFISEKLNELQYRSLAKHSSREEIEAFFLSEFLNNPPTKSAEFSLKTINEHASAEVAGWLIDHKDIIHDNQLRILVWMKNNPEENLTDKNLAEAVQKEKPNPPEADHKGYGGIFKNENATNPPIIENSNMRAK
ncbi:MAG: hypothetical protein A3F18_07195 [Legionellales bacterium RIFCSPHIGHO2_12_FULL_37_14]|nr:MAG: hypothetical protein A3F18_07195 [Legionellales bacterium RIFCSPHIGHO2_12_FULL_37_14]